MDDVEKITKGGKILAILLRKEFDEPGVHFFTPGEFSQQLGMLIHKKGKIVSRHKHKLIKREIFKTQEVLVLLYGKIRVDLFDDDANKVRTIVMKGGDSILLASGGHSVEVIEDSKIIEIKQGPYSGLEEKEYY
jgi:hypothetical protein